MAENGLGIARQRLAYGTVGKSSGMAFDIVSIARQRLAHGTVGKSSGMAIDFGRNGTLSRSTGKGMDH